MTGKKKPFRFQYEYFAKYWLYTTMHSLKSHIMMMATILTAKW